MHSHSRLYRSALALNNIGVRLLERHCYRQAVETLSEATDLIKAVLKRVSFEEEQNVVNMACKRYAHPKPSSKSKNMTVRTLTLTHDLTVHSGGVDALHELLAEIPSASTALPFLIEDESLLEEAWNNVVSDEKILALYSHAAAIFHNASLASLFCNKTKRALRFARVALQIVQHQRVEFGCILLTLAVLNTVVHCLNRSGNHSEAREHYRDLVQIRSQAEQEFDECLIRPSLISLTAAAA